jgi:hypothetical protein
VSKPERGAGIKQYLKARFTCTEIQISTVTAHHKSSRARLSAVAYRGFALHPRQRSIVKQLQDRLCSAEHSFTRVRH